MFEKGRRFLRCAHAHQNHPAAGLLKLRDFPAQLRHLLTAERSPQVAQEHEHNGLIFPQIAERTFRPVRKPHLAFDSLLIAPVHHHNLPAKGIPRENRAVEPVGVS